MALKKFTFHEGTTDNPVVLSQRQIRGLVALSLDESISRENINVNSVVKAESGKMYKSEYNAISSLGFTIIDTTQEADEFSIYFANTADLYEGNSREIYSTNISIEKLDFKISSHEIIISSGNISDDIIKERIHIENGRLIVDAPQENSTWQDTITIQANPKYDTTNKVFTNVPITVKAVELKGIKLSIADSVLINERTTISTEYMPENMTKLSNRIEVTCEKGAIGSGIYLAPAEPCNDIIRAKCYMFGSNSPSFLVEKTINIKQPSIVCNIVDKDGDPVEGAYITIVDGVTGISSQLNNGESMSAVLGRTYSISAYLPEGYTKVVVPENVTTNTLETIVTALYYPIQVGVMAVFNDGSYIAYDEWIDLGLPTQNEYGSELIAAGYIEQDGKSYCFNEVIDCYYAINKQVFDIAKIINTNGNEDPEAIEKALLVTIDKAKKITNIEKNTYTGNLTECAAYVCANKTININGNVHSGYLGCCSQLLNILKNKSKINDIFIKVSGPFVDSYLFSCNENGDKLVYYVDENGAHINYRGGGPYYNGCYKDTNFKTIPLFDLL